MADSKVVPVDSVVTIPRRPTQEVMEAGARALASARIANLHRNENVLACEVFATMIQAWLETHPSMLSAAPAPIAQTVVDVTGPDEMGSMYVRLRPMADGCVKQTRQIQANADYDSDRNLLGVEILSAHVIASPAPAEVAQPAKCCGDFYSLVDAPECRECPARKYYMSKLEVAQTGGEDEPREVLAGRLIDAWCADKGKQIPWAKAIQIMAIVTKQPDAERDRLLKLGDEDGKCGMCGRSDEPPAPTARSDAGLVERLRAGCPLLPESESPDEDMFDYEASNKLMLEAVAALERQGEPVAWYVQDYGITWREGCQPPVPFPSIHKPTAANPEPPRVTMRLYARPAIGGVEK